MVKYIKSTVIGISLLASSYSSFAMDQTNGFTLQPIDNPEGMTGKLAKTYARAVATIKQSGAKTATMPQNSVYALVSNVQGELVGFIGCHQDEHDESRVAIDKIYLLHSNDATHNKLVAFMLLKYALEKHPKAKSIWTPLEKTTVLSDILQAQGFKPSEYLGKHYDAATFQGWECDLE